MSSWFQAVSVSCNAHATPLPGGDGSSQVRFTLGSFAFMCRFAAYRWLPEASTAARYAKEDTELALVACCMPCKRSPN